MLSNKRGVALLQVLIITAILAGMATMILRATLSRQITSRQTRHNITSQLVIESCMAEVNNLWASKTPETYQADLAACRMCVGCETYPDNSSLEDNALRCQVPVPNSADPLIVWAHFTTATPDSSGFCSLEYTIESGINL